MPLLFSHWQDALAIAVFLGGWMAYGRAADNYKNPARPSLLIVMHRLRIKWLTEMQLRPLRMPDSMTLGIITGNYTFFASTSILIVAGAGALLVRSDQWQLFQFIQNFPLADAASLDITHLKLLTIAVVFTYSFFKFTWSIRQASYCAIVLGGVPNAYPPPENPPPDDAARRRAAARAEILAPLFTLAGNNFNYGLRAYYFGLALLTWFIGPLWLLASFSLVAATLWLREFSSKTLVLLQRIEKELDSDSRAA